MNTTPRVHDPDAFTHVSRATEVTWRRRLLLRLVLILGLLVPFGGVMAQEATDPHVLQELAALREASARYHDVTNAVKDGYIRLSHCVEVPGEGGGGIHYALLERLFDLEVDPRKPEMLIYAPAPTPSGLKLVGVEWYVFAHGQPRPILFGQAFYGPLAGDEFGTGHFYALHAWLWEANPRGVFAAYNPNVHC